jgi:hypothetical protein
MSKLINGKFNFNFVSTIGSSGVSSDMISDVGTTNTLEQTLTNIESNLSTLTSNIIIGTTNANTITVNSGSTTYNNTEIIKLKDNTVGALKFQCNDGGPTDLMSINTTNGSEKILINKNFQVMGDLDAVNVYCNTINTTGDIQSNGFKDNNITDSISAISGAIITAGGIGIAKSCCIGTNLKVLGTSASINSGTGSIICSGGVGIAGDMHVGGGVTCSHVISSGSVQGVGIVSSGNIQCYGNTIYGGGIIVTGAITGSIINSSSSINCSSITDTMSTTTGAIITAGGVGIAKSLNVGQSINCNALTCGSACNVGSLVSGGVISGTTITSTIGLKLPTSGGTATALNYYEEATTSIALAPSIGGAYVYNGNVYIIRIGKLVTIRIPFFTGNALGGYMIAAAASGIPVRFRPSSNAVFAIPIMMSNGTSGINQNYPGQLVIASTGEIRIYSSCGGTGTFTSGAGSGLLGDLVVSWTMY